MIAYISIINHSSFARVFPEEADFVGILQDCLLQNHRGNGGKTPCDGGPLQINPINTLQSGYLLGIWPLEGLLEGFKQLGALRLKGFPTIFPMIEISCGGLKKRPQMSCLSLSTTAFSAGKRKRLRQTGWTRLNSKVPTWSLVLWLAGKRQDII